MRHRAAHVESKIVPLFPQSLTIRVVGSVLKDACRRYEKCIVLGQYIFRIRRMGERHNGKHVIHVTPWWRHGKQRRSDSRSFRCRWRSGREVSDHVWINSGPRRFLQWICRFWIPRWQVGIIFGLQSKCCHPIMINNATPCKIVRTIGIMAGSHFDWSLTWIRLIPNEGIYFDAS